MIKFIKGEEGLEREFLEMDQEWLDKPILVYGPRKSGSTLLQNLLDGGDQILMMPAELKVGGLYKKIFSDKLDQIYTYLRIGRGMFTKNLMVSYQKTQTPQISISVKSQFDLGRLTQEQINSRLDVENYIGYLRNMEKEDFKTMKQIYTYDVASFADSLKEKKNYQNWAVKEVGGYPDLVVTHFKSLFPQAKCVFIAREPHFIVRSVILERRRRGVKLSCRKILTECLLAQVVMEFYGKIKTWGKDYCLVFYEDLVQDPREEMEKITNYLGVPYQELYTLPMVMGINVKVATASQDTKKIFKTKIKNWKSNLKLREILVMRFFDFFYKLLYKFVFKKIYRQEYIDYKRLSLLYGNIKKEVKDL